MTVALGETTPGIDAALYEVGAGAVSGTVTDAAGTQVLANVRVTVYSPTEGHGSAYTAADGSYTVVGLPAGTDYRVCFEGDDATGGSARGYADQCWENQPSGTPTPVAVALGATTPGIDAALDEAGAVSGRVTDADGQPLANVGVSVEVPFNVSVGWGVTAADGTYTVTGIPAGDYQVCFYAGLPPGGSTNGYVDECFDNTTPPVAPTLLTVMAGVTRTGTDASLVEAGSVAGTVTDAVTGLPLADVWVTVSYGHPGPESPGANTAADGTYKMTGLPAGDYQVCFRGWGASVGYASATTASRHRARRHR